MLKAIIFDLDDTLIDWGEFDEEWDKVETPHIKKAHTYLSERFADAPDLLTFKSEYLRRTSNAWAHARNTLIAPHIGRTLFETVVALGVDKTAITREDLMKAYDWGKIPGTTVFPDVIPGLTRLQAAGLQFGLVTNAYQPMLLRDVEMEQHGLLTFFPSCRFSAADHGYLKPHPSIFEAVLTCLGIEPEDAVFIGDNPTADVAGAQAAGMRAILRVTARRKPLLSGVIIPDAAINSFDELPAVLKGWFPGWEDQQKDDV